MCNMATLKVYPQTTAKMLGAVAGCKIDESMKLKPCFKVICDILYAPLFGFVLFNF